MSSHRTTIAALTGLLALPALARAGDLTLNFERTLDLTQLQLNSIGDLAMESGAAKLWICDGATNGGVLEVNPVTGALISQFNAGAVPGLNLGADALAIARTSPDPDVFLFSSFGESEAGRVTQTGALVAEFASSHGATGADFDLAGNLWIAAGTTAGGGATLMRLSTTNGAVLASVPIQGTTLRVVDLAFDPHTGACHCFFEDHRLIEVNTSTGAQISAVDLSGILPGSGGTAGGLAFGGHGRELYVAVTNAAAGNHLSVLRRDYTTSVCDGTGVFALCPCGNAGLPGHGCDNSFGTGGAVVTATGVPSVAFDSFALHVAGLPPTAPCLFFQGTGTFESTPLAQGDGLICIAGAVIRLSTKIPSDGAASFPVGNDPELHVRGQIPVSGGTRLYQVWYRNAASFCTPSTFNFSNAFSVLWEP